MLPKLGPANFPEIPPGAFGSLDQTGQRKRQRLKLQLVSKKEIRLAGPIHHRVRSGPAVDCVPRLGGSVKTNWSSRVEQAIST